MRRAIAAVIFGGTLLGATAVVLAAPGVAPPAPQPAPGAYPAPLTVTLSSATSGATIYYTLDGSGPSRQTSPVYRGPLILEKATTVKAFAWHAGMTASAVVKADYKVTAPPPPPPPPPDPSSTLFLATLSPQPGAASSGTGSASLQLAPDARTAVFRMSHASLTGPLSGAHIHGPGGAILFDIDDAPVRSDGTRLWQVRGAGTLDAAAVVDSLRAGNCYVNLHTAAYPSGEILGFLRRVNGSVEFTPPPDPPELPGTPPTADQAARFLMQAGFGPRLEEIDAVKSLGYRGWLDGQFAKPRQSVLAAYDARVKAGQEPNSGLTREAVLQQMIEGDDPLRQRVAFALSELFVVSDRDGDVRRRPDGLAGYADLLAEHAFGNFRGLLGAVTLHPTMGVYLDMAHSAREDLALDLHPNENYAREVLQLFSIGLFSLHPDGTLKLTTDGEPIPTYGQETVEGFARAFTGWSIGGQARHDERTFFRPRGDFRVAMEVWPQYHEPGEKLLLDGHVLPAGGSAQADLDAALDAVFAHPNVGPFVCRRLIQRLVSSNPTPGYLYRCGLAFADDGHGVRGDMKAVLAAILLDYEARSADVALRQDFGHLREPLVRLVGLLRTLHAKSPAGRYRFTALDRSGLGLGQSPYRAPTVFNFFTPDFALPGEIASAGLVSPEFEIATATTVVGAANFIGAVLQPGFASRRLNVDLAPFQTPQVKTDDELLDRVDLLFFGGAMSAETRSILRDALASADFPKTPDARVLRLLWLANLAPEGAIEK